jgi:serine phosphatase RsbU (regulator of sigma subunit)
MRRRGSLKWEILFFIIALQLTVIGALSVLVLNTQKQSLTNEVKLRGLSITRNLARNIADFMLTEDELSSAKLLSDTMENKGVKYALVVDEYGDIKAHNNVDLMGSKYGNITEYERLEDPVYDVRLFVDNSGERVIDFNVPVVAKGKLKLGDVHVGLSHRIIDDVLNAAYMNILIIIIFAVVLAFFGAAWLATTITKPILVLARSAKLIGAGNLEHRVKLKSRNEIGALAGVLNMMTIDLKQAQEVAIKQNRIEKELDVAREIQLSLIPKNLETINGYEIAAYYLPAREVGGDYYDVLPLGEGKSGFVMGDVSGKGVPAAFMMTMARSILHSEAGGHLESKDVLQRLNAVIFPDMREGMFITVFYGVLDTKENTIDMASAGHNDTLVMRHALGIVVKHNPKGFAIGMDPGDRFNEVVKNEIIGIEPGDTVVMFTDGITEAMNSVKDEYGQDRLVNVLRANREKSAGEIVGSVIEDVKDFVKGFEQSDDIAILALKRIREV